MNLLILGPTGGTGQQLVAQALKQNHNVTALARNPEKLNLKHERLTVVKGDALDEKVLNNLVQNKDAVLSALGVGKSLKSHDLITNAAGLLVKVMRNHNVNRLIFVSAFGVGQSFEMASFIQKLIFRLPLHNLYADKERSEVTLKRSDLSWTIVYPVLLTDGPHTGNYRAVENIKMKGMPKISRADVADFMLRELSDNSFVRKFPIIMA